MTSRYATVRPVFCACFLAFAAGCVSAPATRPEAPPPFEALRRVQLLRPVARERTVEQPLAVETGRAALWDDQQISQPSGRERDVLDAVRENVEAGGRSARIVEVGPRLRQLDAGVARLVKRLEAKVLASPPGRGGKTLTRVDPPAELVDLAVDAAVIYLPAVARPSQGPSQALVLVDRPGNLFWIEWSDAKPARPGVAAQPEALDAILKGVTGADPMTPMAPASK